MAAAASLNYYFVTPDHTRSPFAVVNLPFKCCVNRVYTFLDIAIWKFHKFGLKCLFWPPKIMFWGVLTLNFTFYHWDPQKALPCAETRVLSPHWSWSVLRWDLDATRRVQEKNELNVSKKSPFCRPSFRRPTSYKFCMRGRIRISLLVLSFRKIGWKCGIGGGRIFGFPIDLAHRLSGLPWIWISMWISDLSHPVDILMDIKLAHLLNKLTTYYALSV